ncbi:hypothetical protein FA95DRAFT_1605933 [Auriscalpium vulgare]|uniref:Uncharacterized protein n=1 Tax=Auriscalpium vulgare TaxID=40419 RepID=A0ACB8RUY9_9AGAM|nr:hypothetical protein FA95DRAFT_1605933 [Auriscalpium vulgare]
MSDSRSDHDNAALSQKSSFSPPAAMPPCLQEFIPQDHLPDALSVRYRDDLYRNENPYHGQRVWEHFVANNALEFRRVKSDLTSDAGEEPNFRIASLNLEEANLLGVGNHSRVYIAPFQLPPPLHPSTPSGTVSVACKTAINDEEPRSLLENESKIYAQFPRSLQEELLGRHSARPDDRPEFLAAVVPKSYGYYKIAFEESKAGFEENIDEETKQGISRYVRSLSPILLMENCGDMIVPFRMPDHQKNHCLELIARLHGAGFTQGSLYPRNIVVQPGPLTLPPAARRLHTPSFRIIDFGKGVYFDPETCNEKAADFGSFLNDMLTEEARARREFNVDMPDGRFELCTTSYYY